MSWREPDLTVLVKLASIAVHADEATDPKTECSARSFDVTALRQLLDDEDVKRWLTAMDQMGFVPKKR